MTASSVPQRAAAIPRSADWLIGVLAVLALVFAWGVRQEVLGATRAASIPGVQFAIPDRSIPVAGKDQFAASTADGLLIRANQIPAPVVGTDPQALTASRTLTQARAHDLYRTVSTSNTMVNGKPGSILEYMYVNASQESVFASPLEIVHGYELLVPQSSQVAVISLEGPESRWSDVQDLWPTLINSLRLSEVNR